jgi:hypothetical protein
MNVLLPNSWGKLPPRILMTLLVVIVVVAVFTLVLRLWL